MTDVVAERSEIRPKEPPKCTTATTLAATVFRRASGPEIRLYGDVYRRTSLDDGPRYIKESEPCRL